jgi:hypothetical protein
METTYTHEDYLAHLQQLKPEGYSINNTHYFFEKNVGNIRYEIFNFIEEYYPHDVVFTGLGLDIRFNDVEQIMHLVANNVNFNIKTLPDAPTLTFDFSRNILGEAAFLQMCGINVSDDASFNMVRPYLDQLMNATLSFINQYPTLLSLHNYIEAFTPQERANIYCTPPATRIIIKKLVGQPYTDIANTLIQGLNQRGDTEEANYYQALKTHLENL